MKKELDKLRGADLAEVIDFLKQEGTTYQLVEVHPPENRQGQRRPGQGSRRFINAVPQDLQAQQNQQARQNQQVRQEDQEDKAEFIIYYCYERYDYE